MQEPTTPSTCSHHKTALQCILPLFPHRRARPKTASAIKQAFPGMWKTRDIGLDYVICWPANLFGMTSSLLQATDAYKHTVCPPERGPSWEWPPNIETLFVPEDERWRTVLNWLRTRERVPKIDPPALIDHATRRPSATAARDANEWWYLMATCGREWATYLNNRLRKHVPELRRHIGFRRGADPKSPCLAQPAYLDKLYRHLLPAWDQFRKQSMALRPKGLTDRQGAALALCLFWNEMLVELEGPLTGSGQSRRGRGIMELHTKPRLFASVMALHAIADEAGTGWGTHKSEQLIGKASLRSLLSVVQPLLEGHGTLALTPPQGCRVLPKRHTPRVGMTLRNYSLNLAFHQSAVEVRWHQEKAGFAPIVKKQTRPLESISILLLPWPLEVRLQDFRPVDPNGKPPYFHFNPDIAMSKRELMKRKDQLCCYVRDALKQAKHEAGSVHMVILPEVSLTRNELSAVEDILASADVRAYIAGVRGPGKGTYAANTVYCRTREAKGPAASSPSRESKGRRGSAFGPRNHDAVQGKHHRWCLGRPQITQYQLGGILSPRQLWWEKIALSDVRSVRFINIGGELTLCPLICEDLARQEPIGDLIRAVGPSIVVAILLDGPQLASRWSARYASVLADDPGSAVITLTPLGMVDRCRSGDARKSRAIALWSESGGSPRAIELEAGANAVLLSVDVEEEQEHTADVRRDRIFTNSVTLGGVYHIQADTGEGRSAGDSAPRGRTVRRSARA